MTGMSLRIVITCLLDNIATLWGGYMFIHTLLGVGGLKLTSAIEEFCVVVMFASSVLP